MFDDIFSRLDTIQYTNVADRQTPADSKDRANAWRHAVKTIFAHAPLCPVMASFQSEYGITAEQIVLS